MRKNLIITGMPRSGKSILLKKIILNYENKVGFVTNEMLKDGERVGFEVETQSGEKSILAHINFKSALRVSKYFVKIDNLDKIIPNVAKFNAEDLLYLDEVGQMELFSEKFKELTIKYLNSLNICIVTLSKIYSNDFTEKIKGRGDVILIEITEKNREEKFKLIENLIKKVKKAKRYLNEPARFSIKNDGMILKTDHGIRNLERKDKGWACNCDFFHKNKICSHIIALEEFKDKSTPE